MPLTLPSQVSEHRHGLSITSCDTFVVRGLHISETGGDGVYVVYSVHTEVRDVTTDGAYRNGLSIIDAWLRRKLTELLGEEEESMIEFITDSLSSRCEPAALLEELEPVFDDAAAEFTADLWRTVVLESLYAKHGV